MQVSIILVTWNAAKDIEACLGALFSQTTSTPYHVYIVDNNSSDTTLEHIKHFPIRHLITNTTNNGFAGANNQALNHILNDPMTQSTDYVLCLNTDTIVATDWLQQILAAFERNPHAGAIGCKMYYPGTNIIQHAGGWINWETGACPHYWGGEHDHGQADEERSVDFVTGASLGLRISALQTIGLFDEAFNPAYYEDADLCVRLQQAGYTLVYTPDATLQHAEGASDISLLKSQLIHRKRLQFLLKYQADDSWLGRFKINEQKALAKNDLIEILSRQHSYFYARTHMDEWNCGAQGQASSMLKQTLEDLFEYAHSVYQAMTKTGT